MDYPNRGTLWTNDYKKLETHPDMKGDIKLEISLLKDLLVNAESDHVVIKLGAWLGKHTDGKRKITLKFDPYKKEAPAASSAKDPWDD
jgi:hypothetical protein|tara:strand:+ start:381 stop:644 length:264 start_codon:yes stop_codon:yes gene_type:complete